MGLATLLAWRIKMPKVELPTIEMDTTQMEGFDNIDINGTVNKQVNFNFNLNGPKTNIFKNEGKR